MSHSKKHLPKILGLLILVTLALAACATPAAATEADAARTADGEPAVVTVSNETATTTINANGLTDAEIEGLLYMREEEKLAHDVYLALYDLWGLRLFQNIAASEQSHTEAVLHLLVTYGIDDPAEGAAAGEFTNPTLQSLYDELTAAGARSLADAIKVGAAIEEIDILDLQDNLTTLTNQAIRQVYENLLSGSENHLRAFVTTLSRQTGETYAPQYLSEAVYNAILSERAQNNAPMQGNAGGRGRRP